MYTVLISESALKQLAKLPKNMVRKIRSSINGLASDPRPIGVKKLKDSKEDLYRVRVGDYRVVYSIEDKIQIVDIRQIGHRKDIYR